MTKAAEAMQISEIVIESPSSRSAPLTRSFVSTALPDDQSRRRPERDEGEDGVSTRWRVPAASPPSKTTTIPAVSAMTGESPA